jgi:hypothetical protein
MVPLSVNPTTESSPSDDYSSALQKQLEIIFIELFVMGASSNEFIYLVSNDWYILINMSTPILNIW